MQIMDIHTMLTDALAHHVARTLADMEEKSEKTAQLRQILASFNSNGAVISNV